jgi:hypothetical protein
MLSVKHVAFLIFTGPVAKPRARSEEHIADPGNKRLEQTSRRQRRKEECSEGGQDPERVVTP